MGQSGRSILVGPAVCCAFLLLGCAKQKEGHLKVYKTTGEVFADGEPAELVMVTFHPVKIDPEHPMRPYAVTDSEGRFAASTYNQGDGLASGEYVITIEWRQYSIMSGSFSGPDKFGGQYSDPETSELRVVVDEEPVEIPRFELEKKASPPSKSRRKGGGLLGSAKQ